MASELLAQYFWYLFAAVFLAGTLLLSRTKFQRTFIIFLIRTARGSRLLERLGGLSPQGWLFLGDLATIISFGGLGAAYVARHRSVTKFLLILGVLAIILLLPLLRSSLPGGPMVWGTAAAALLLLLLVGLFLQKTAPAAWKGKAAFVLGSLILFGAMLGFAGAVRPGPSAWAIAGVTGLFGLPGLLVGALASQAANILTQESALPGVTPLLPGINPAGDIGFIFPGLDIFIPLWSGLLALIILLASHEFCHGILAKIQGIPVKSMGVLTFGILPIGAFVEPDEKALQKKRSEEKMRVYAMGSFANLMIAILAILLLGVVSLQAGGMVFPAGVEIAGVQEGFPAATVLEKGMVITALNGVPVATSEEYLNQSALVRPGENVTLQTGRDNRTLTAATHPQNSSRAYLGVTLQTRLELKPELEGQRGFFSLLLGLGSLLNIIFFLNLNVAIVNLLPVAPFDGSKMFEELLKSFRLRPELRRQVTRVVVVLVLLLILLNALPLGRIALGAFGS